MNINVVPATGYSLQATLSTDDIDIIPLTQSDQLETAIDGLGDLEGDALTYSVIEVDITKFDDGEASDCNLADPNRPSSPNEYNDAEPSGEHHYRDTNVMVVLSISGSMKEAPHEEAASTNARMGIAKAVLTNLLHAYDTLGEVRVTVVLLNERAAVHFSWGSVAGAIASLDTLASEGTSYAEAQNVAQAAWAANGKLKGDTEDVIYFLSDGKPTIGGGNHLNDGQTPAWSAFLESSQNGIDRVYAVGVGDDIGSRLAPDSSHCPASNQWLADA